MNTTGNYKLKKPEGTDPVNIQDFNDNADIVDAELAKRAPKDVATQSANGLMSAADKKKLDGVSTGANNYTHPSAHGAGMITQDSSHRFVTDAEKSVWNAKQNAITIDDALSSTSTNPVQNKAVTAALGGKAAAVHTHNYAGSSSAGGAATTALVCTGNSATATKAAQDSAGQQINTTYIKSLAVNGRMITYTKGNGTTGTITTQDTNTTYGTATQSANGLMSAADKTKLDGIVTGANKTAVDSALSSTSTNPVQNKAVTAALGGKAAAVHTHNYAGSSSAGGAATSAVKLTTSAGSSTQPVYFSGGKPVLCGFEFYVVDIKAPQGGSTSVTLPNGFSYENTIVVGYLAYAQQTSINVFGGNDGINALSIKIDSNSKLTISPKTSGVYGASAKILLVKVG